eukprot:CAMPEP_0184344048 /NCGR_PEP_ID=MMETSP1089-20130417/12571_1 /TAXON_ID=38269 ORGANISM="Gloeochaete wittrockiana, Strain SAG46.84" /NCGR_SAMPLE_ID=MMETSP1089 /ASSEMBLY_ACC=CAM_ASM_000445 /LENGTH=196 /DNA_ID=CAMNT_0026673687 /DNA_START=43 /DNA_END=630 /DNA_ORIENTATION=-
MVPHRLPPIKTVPPSLKLHGDTDGVLSSARYCGDLRSVSTPETSLTANLSALSLFQNERVSHYISILDTSSSDHSSLSPVLLTAERSGNLFANTPSADKHQEQFERSYTDLLALLDEASRMGVRTPHGSVSNIRGSTSPAPSASIQPSAAFLAAPSPNTMSASASAPSLLGTSQHPSPSPIRRGISSASIAITYSQ